MLDIQHLSVSYGQHAALNDVSLTVQAGEIVVMLGANGAGKSTLLKSAAGLVPHQPGAVLRLNGQDIAGQPAHLIVEQGLALVPEGRGIFGDLTVRENLMLGAYAKRARASQSVMLEQVLTLFPRLEERLTQIARTMSGGEQQMVAIGRALMSCPTVLLLDEPSLGLSPIMSSELFKALQTVSQTGVGMLVVEQNARLSLSIAHRGYLLENGRVVGEGQAQALQSDPAVQQAYLGLAKSASVSTNA